jgi:KDO2-lipid IV(A) lauroyltransferase
MISLLLYPISLLPLRVLYLVSDICAYFLYHIFKYRRDVVKDNISKSLVNLNKKERVEIEKQFYKNFCDNFIETIKLISLPIEKLQSHITADYSELEKVLENNTNCHIYLGHQFNWEWANAHIASTFKNENVIVAYKPLRSKAFNDLMLKIRSRFGSKMVASKSMKKEMRVYANKKHVLLLVADQSPSIPNRSFWTTFMSQQTPFISGTELYSRSQKTPILFATIIRVKRGHYKFVLEPLFDFSEPYKTGIITQNFKIKLENAIITNPENYLWSHKRWKHQYKEEYQKRWIDLQSAV